MLFLRRFRPGLIRRRLDVGLFLVPLLGAVQKQFPTAGLLDLMPFDRHPVGTEGLDSGSAAAMGPAPGAKTQRC